MTYLKERVLRYYKGGKEMNAVIKVGGKQYYVSEGTEIFVEKLNAEEGNTVNFNQVLMLDKKVGSPYLTGVTVEGEVLKNGIITRKDNKMMTANDFKILLDKNKIDE
jgi:ribosomal protein L21